jgi:coenzyme Q-binding protein COQ10
MRRFETTRQVPHSAADMFALVADIESYPRFVPLCKALTVQSRARDGEVERLVARMTAAYGPLNETFTSKVTLDRRRLQILVEYVEGPFRHMENRWGFADLPAGGSAVHFFIAYEFRSLPLQLLVGGLFDHAFQKMAEAFARRADQIYGRARIKAENSGTPRPLD